MDVEQIQKVVVDSKKEMEEKKDRENRENNIVIYNSIENRSDNKTEWFNSEMKFCLDLCNDVLGVGVGVVKDDITQTTRLGKRENNLKRPLLVQFKSKAVKNRVMESLTRLRGADEPFKSIVVSHDLTKNEREVRTLVNLAKEKQEENGQGNGYPVQENFLL